MCQCEMQFLLVFFFPYSRLAVHVKKKIIKNKNLEILRRVEVQSLYHSRDVEISFQNF